MSDTKTFTSAPGATSDTRSGGSAASAGTGRPNTATGRTGVNGAASMADLAAGLIEDAQDLVKLEIDLAKQEVKELAKSNAFAAGYFAGAAFVGMFAVLTWLFMVIVMALLWAKGPAWGFVATVVVFVLFLVGAGILALIGKSKLAIHAPQKTIKQLKETKEWAVRQMKSPAR